MCNVLCGCCVLSVVMICIKTMFCASSQREASFNKPPPSLHFEWLLGNTIRQARLFQFVSEPSSSLQTANNSRPWTTSRPLPTALSPHTSRVNKEPLWRLGIQDIRLSHQLSCRCPSTHHVPPFSTLLPFFRPSSTLTVPLSDFFFNVFVDTPKSLKLIDSYMVYVLLTGIIQFVYVVIAGTFPNNAFLAGFISTVASFVLAGLCGDKGRFALQIAYFQLTTRMDFVQDT